MPFIEIDTDDLLEELKNDDPKFAKYWDKKHFKGENIMNFKGVTKETILRTVVLGIALLNQVFVMLGRGVIPITDEEIYQYGTLILTGLSALWAWWKNNSFTAEAQAADEVMKELKAENKIVDKDEQITE